MADIVDPQVIKFANERTRTICDMLAADLATLIEWALTGSGLTIFFLAAAICFGQTLIDFRTQVRNKTADQITYTAPGTGAVPRTQQSKDSDVLSVKDFGAKGDSSTDDTVAIQTAITSAGVLAAAMGTPYTVTFPSGTYAIKTVSGSGATSNFFTIPAGVQLTGPGTLQVQTATVYSTIFYSAGGLSNVTFSNFTVDHNGGTYKWEGPDIGNNRENTFLFWDSSNIIIDNITILNGNGAQEIVEVVTSPPAPSNMIIRNCNILNAGVNANPHDYSATYLMGDNDVVLNNLIQASPGYQAISAIEIHNNHHLISGNTVRGFINGILWYSDLSGGSTDMSIVGNYITGYAPIVMDPIGGPLSAIQTNDNEIYVDPNTNYGNGIATVNQTDGLHEISDWQINGNHIFYTSAVSMVQSGGVGAGISLTASIFGPSTSSFHNISITNNHIYFAPHACIGINGGAVFEGINISGNTCVDPGQDTYSPPTRFYRSGVFVALTAGGTFQNSSIHDNTFIDDQSTYTMNQVVALDPGVTNAPNLWSTSDFDKNNNHVYYAATTWPAPLFAFGVTNINVTGSPFGKTVFQDASGEILSGRYLSGITATGTGTCLLSAFNGAGSAGKATVAVVSNVIAANTPLIITSPGYNYTSAPTSATVGTGTATCSGTAVVSTVLASVVVTPSNAVFYTPATASAYQLFDQNNVARRVAAIGGDGTGYVGDIDHVLADTLIWDAKTQHQWRTVISGTPQILMSLSATSGLGLPYFSAASYIPSMSNSGQGHGLCLKSGGPPVVIGYCSTVLASDGSCTCN